MSNTYSGSIPNSIPSVVPTASTHTAVPGASAMSAPSAPRSAPTTAAPTGNLMDQVRQINRTTGAQWTQVTMADYVEALQAGNLTLAQLREVGQAQSQVRADNLARVDILADSLGLPAEYINMFTESYLSLGDVNLALTQVRADKAYERFFPGNLRENGTARYSEREYQMVVESYAATLEDYGVNPDVYADKFAGMVSGDVAPDEFAQRVDALYSRVIRAPEEVRQAFAAEFGVSAAMSDSAILGVALDPEIAEAARNRRLDIATITGQATRFGFNRSRARVRSLLDAGLTDTRAAEFYSGAAANLGRLRRSGMLTGENADIGLLEDAAINRDANSLRKVNRLSAQESSRYSRSATVARGSGIGLLTGLDT